MRHLQPSTPVRAIGLCWLAVLVTVPGLAQEGRPASADGLAEARAADAAFRIESCDQATLTPAAAQMRADGGTGTVRVTAGDGCAWTAVSNDSWITITDGATGTGRGDALYTAAANSSAEARTGTLAIGGSTYSLRQAGQRSADITLIRTLQVTPDGNFTGGGFVRIYDSPTTGRVLVTFNTGLDQPEGGCGDSAHVYEEYTTDLQATGNKGDISCRGGVDIGSLLVGNSYYLATMHREGDQQGWQIDKYDATSWAQQVSVFRPVDYPREIDNDPMIAYVNGQLDVSSQYNASGTPGDPSPGSFHLFFSPSLQFLGERRLTDTPNIHGSSMLVVDGVTYFVTANAYLGDLVVMKYDASWNYLGARTLVTNGLFSEGLAFDGQRFYLAYMDTTLRTGNQLPVSLNVRLAAFDRDWNLIEDVPVTSFDWADLRQPGRPYLLLHSDRLYVSYDCDTIDPITHQEMLKGQVYVAMFDISTDVFDLHVIRDLPDVGERHGLRRRAIGDRDRLPHWLHGRELVGLRERLLADRLARERHRLGIRHGLVDREHLLVAADRHGDDRREHLRGDPGKRQLDDPSG